MLEKYCDPDYIIYTGFIHFKNSCNINQIVYILIHLLFEVQFKTEDTWNQFGSCLELLWTTTQIYNVDTYSACKLVSYGIAHGHIDTE